MLPVLNSNYWFPTMFDEFFNNEWMPKAKATAPAVNVKEDAKAYTMEIAVPGVKKEYCRGGHREQVGAQGGGKE